MTPNQGQVIQGFFLPGGLRAPARPAPVPVPPPARVAQLQQAGPRSGAPARPPQPLTPAVQPSRSGPAIQLHASALTLGRSPGERLPAVVQQKMEALFNTSFADVRVHVGPEAAAIGALAFTSGQSLYFAPGQYNPAMPHGQKLIAHELTHVVQQREGRVRNPFGSGVAVVQDLCLEAEAERMASRLAVQPPPARPKPVQPKTVQARLAPPPLQSPRGRAVPRPVARVPGQGAAIQPCGCWDGIVALFRRLFGSSDPQPAYVQLPARRTFGPDEGPSAIRIAIEQRQDDNWLTDTTCSTSARRVFETVGQITTLGSGIGHSSLQTYMKGAGSRVDEGVVIQVKVGQSGFSQHEFTIVQKGNECYLIQAWLDKISLEEGLRTARLRGIDDLLGDLERLEAALKSGSSEERRAALERTFGVTFSDTDWQQDRVKWGYGVQLSWEARARR